MRRIQREPAVANVATAQIRTAILTGELAPGTRVRQEALATRLAVSRSPVRQALAVLEREGLIQRDPRYGSIVAPLDAAFIRDLYEFRGAIERYVAATLAERPGSVSGQCRQIVTAGQKAVSSGDQSRLIELDLQFHTMLYDAVGNSVLSDIMRGQWAHIRRVMAATLRIAGYPPQVWKEHSAILDAIEFNDPERARTLAGAHIDAGARLTFSLTRVAVDLEPVAKSRARLRSRPPRPVVVRPRRARSHRSSP